MPNADKFPTMIIPEGTEIRLDESGQLSIRTTGNLVIQNSGTYGEEEVTHTLRKFGAKLGAVASGEVFPEVPDTTRFGKRR